MWAWVLGSRGGFYGHQFYTQREIRIGGSRPPDAAVVGVGRHAEYDRHEVWLRDGAVRSVYRAYQRRSHAVMHYADFGSRRKENHNHRRAFGGRQPSGAAGLD